MKKIEIY